ncbi:MAG: heme ABC transporter permease [Rhodospirillales bacterium]
MHHFANPTRFQRLSTCLEPWVLGIMLVCFAAGLYFALFASPVDYQQGHTVRIMYIHVPAAWMALFCYTAMAVSAAVALIWKHALADIAAKATAPIGAGFTLLALITGSLWGKPMWGTWWVWDARLTSVLVLFFLYLGYMALRDAFDDPVRGARASSILALVGFVNVPVIKFSVDWWNTLHQPSSVMRMDGPTVHPDMLLPLLLMAAAFQFYYLWLLLIRIREALMAQRLRSLRHRQAQL